MSPYLIRARTLSHFLITLMFQNLDVDFEEPMKKLALLHIELESTITKTNIKLNIKNCTSYKHNIIKVKYFNNIVTYEINKVYKNFLQKDCSQFYSML